MTVRHEDLGPRHEDVVSARMVLKECGMAPLAPENGVLVKSISGILARERALAGIRVYGCVFENFYGDNVDELASKLFASACGWD
jgi:hypothetical protein